MLSFFNRLQVRLLVLACKRVEVVFHVVFQLLVFHVVQMLIALNLVEKPPPFNLLQFGLLCLQVGECPVFVLFAVSRQTLFVLLPREVVVVLVLRA